MKIVDEKGRLFGKINIVDFFIAILLIGVIPIFLYTYKVLGTAPRRVPLKWIKVEVVVFTLPEIAELFEPGDITFDGYGNADGRLLKVIKRGGDFGHRVHMATTKSTGYARYRIPVFLELELLCTLSAVGEAWYYRRRPLYISLDKAFTLDTETYSVMCHVMKVKPE